MKSPSGEYKLRYFANYVYVILNDLDLYSDKQKGCTHNHTGEYLNV